MIIFKPFSQQLKIVRFLWSWKLKPQMMKSKSVLYEHPKVRKSPGPDDLILKFFKQRMHIILPVLNKLFNRLFSNGYFPSCWSKSILVPLHKKGDINNPENYRGICLLDVMAKIFTSIFNRRVLFT